MLYGLILSEYSGLLVIFIGIGFKFSISEICAKLNGIISFFSTVV